MEAKERAQNRKFTTETQSTQRKSENSMPKITLVGAGSLVFTRNLCNDILLPPCLRQCTITLMDIEPKRLEQSRRIVQSIVDRKKLPAKIEATTDRKSALRDSD